MKKKTKQVDIRQPEIEILPQGNPQRLKLILGVMIAIFAFLLYVPSVNFSYVLDDATVTTNNNLVNQGIKSIPKILSTDYWYGFGELRVPQYRPMSLVVLATEWQILPDQPKFYHFINVVLFALSCWLLFLTLSSMLTSGRVTPKRKPYSLLFPFVATILYAAHPIHTEVVNNIKSVDELLCFLSGLLSVLMALQYARKNSILTLSVSVICFFISLLSKETGIAFLILIPLTIYFFCDVPLKKIVFIFIACLFAPAIFLIIRYYVLKDVPVTTGFESVLNNSLFGAPDFISQKATAIFVLFRYVVLLIFPHPLSYDYSFNEIAIQKITDIGPLAGIVIYLGIFVYAINKLKEKSIISYAILFYLITLFPVSNLALVIGSPMAERFLYMPSLGFVIILTWAIARLTKTELLKSDRGNVIQFFKSNSKVMSMVSLILIFYSAKTVVRSQDWTNNGTLFVNDVKYASNSARAHYDCGISYLVDLSAIEKDQAKKVKLWDKAINELERSLKILPTYPHSNYYLGQAYMNKDDLRKSIENYEIALKVDTRPSAILLNNLGSLYAKVGEFNKSLIMLDSALKLNPGFAHAYNNKAFAYLNLGKNQEAIEASTKAIKYDSLFAKPFMNMGCAYVNLKVYDKAMEYLNKSASLDPNDFQTVYFKGVLYYNQGDTATANRYFAQSNQMKAGMVK